MAHSKYQLNENLKSRYGLSKDEYSELCKLQENECAICLKSFKEEGKRLSVDHDHETGDIRGILCNNCNSGLGMFMDNPLFLIKAANYLVDPPAKKSYVLWKAKRETYLRKKPIKPA